MSCETFRVNAKDREPLRHFIVGALEAEGCRIIYSSPPTEAPFRFTFETRDGERIGIVCYAFLATRTPTRNRPEDERSFQVKYGSKDGKLHRLWQDPHGLYVTLFLGIDPKEGFFVAADPEMHNPTRFFIRIEFKDEHAEEIKRSGWHAWERAKRNHPDEPVEILVGGTAKSFLKLIRFEREACREDQGHRQLLAEKVGSGAAVSDSCLVLPQPPELILVPSPARVHALAREFDLAETSVLDLIGKARMLKMAVRGYVAEEHLFRKLMALPGVTECQHAGETGGTDVSLRFDGSRLLRVECKNALRQTTAAGHARVDLQRTRASKKDPCSRYYKYDEFDVIAACLHAVTEAWEFRFAVSGELDEHKRCAGRLSNLVHFDAAGDTRWSDDARRVLRRAAEAS